MVTVLIVILVLMLLGVIPAWLIAAVGVTVRAAGWASSC